MATAGAPTPGRMLVRVVVCAAVLGLLALVVNHFTSDDPLRDVPRTTPLPEASVRDAGCPEDGSEMPVFAMGGIVGDGAVPAGFQPHRLVRCHLSESYADETRSSYTLVEERAESLPADLLEVVALPDQEFTDPHTACNLVPDPWVVTSVVDRDGTAVVPRLPRDPCGAPRAEVAQMLDGLSWVPVSSSTVDVVR